MQNLLSTLTIQFEELQRRNDNLMRNLKAVTSEWLDISKENCELQAELTHAQAVR